MTSSVGRLFDAASAILGICEHPTYESEAAVLLEAAVRNTILQLRGIDSLQDFMDRQQRMMLDDDA